MAFQWMKWNGRWGIAAWMLVVALPSVPDCQCCSCSWSCCNQKQSAFFAQKHHCFCILPASVKHFMNVWVFMPTLERPQKGGVGTDIPSEATTEHLSMYVCVCVGTWRHHNVTSSAVCLQTLRKAKCTKKRNRTKIPEAITKASCNCVKIRAINAVVVMMAFGTCQQGEREWERATPQKSREQSTHRQRSVCCCMLWVYAIWLGLFGACLWRGALFGNGYSEEVWGFVSLQESEYFP